MKKTFIALTMLLCAIAARADEGMWFLKLMQQQHLVDSLKKAGLQLPPEALYSETATSLRDCIGVFGGGCTGEVVSPDGLVFTNHHCGFSYVHDMSTKEHNYTKDGFFAHSRAEELSAPNLSFTFVLKIEDVTDEVLALAKEQGVSAAKMQSQSFLEPMAEQRKDIKEFEGRKGISAEIIPFFDANRFYMIWMQKYTDVRLVASPPQNIGQFGGNTDNWMWPRHNADFAVFRIYADKDGQPADYSAENRPLATPKYLPISLAGPQKGDYTMIMGFPGSTDRYLTASQVALRTGSFNAPIVAAGYPLLDFYKKLMDQSDELRLRYEDTYFSWANSIKNFDGMNQAVEREGLIAEKKAEEARFRAFAQKSGKPEYANIIERIDSMCAAAKDSLYDGMLFVITLGEQELNVPVSLVQDFERAVKERQKDKIGAIKEKLLAAAKEIDRTGLGHDRDKMKLLIPLFLKYKKLAAQPSVLDGVTDVDAYVDNLYDNSLFLSEKKLAAVLDKKNAKALMNDPLVKQILSYLDYAIQTRSKFMSGYREVNAELSRTYVRGLCEMYDWSKAPDANFTMRMTYGHVTDLKPRDGVLYDWKTNLDGMFEKESKTESDYFVNDRLRQLWLDKDFGRYGVDGKLPTCFLSNNDITGGNSGSAVLNAKGELIGLAFDGNIESLSGDLKFNPTLQRCINVDVRYVLFVLDKFGGSTYLFDELEIR